MKILITERRKEEKERIWSILYAPLDLMLFLGMEYKKVKQQRMLSKSYSV